MHYLFKVWRNTKSQQQEVEMVEELRTVLKAMSLRNAEKYLMSAEDQKQNFVTRLKSLKPVQAMTKQFADLFE